MIKSEAANKLLFLLFIFLFLFVFPYNQKAGEGKSITAKEKETGFAVVELFTSEGCSSCPPADKLMNALEMEAEKTSKDIYFLAMHVSYWDYIGWKDIYGKKAFTARQNFYASYFPGGKSYTPQMIVNGSIEFIGSEEEQARQQIRNGLAKKSEPLFRSLSLSRIDSTVVLVNYELLSLPQKCNLQFALIEKKLPVSDVKKGENKGKKLNHYSVVRVLESSENKELKGTHKIVYPANSKNFSLVCFVQNMENREIMAVTKVILN